VVCWGIGCVLCLIVFFFFKLNCIFCFLVNFFYFFVFCFLNFNFLSFFICFVFCFISVRIDGPGLQTRGPPGAGKPISKSCGNVAAPYEDSFQGMFLRWQQKAEELSVLLEKKNRDS